MFDHDMQTAFHSLPCVRPWDISARLQCYNRDLSAVSRYDDGRSTYCAQCIEGGVLERASAWLMKSRYQFPKWDLNYQKAVSFSWLPTRSVKRSTSCYPVPIFIPQSYHRLGSVFDIISACCKILPSDSHLHLHITVALFVSSRTNITFYSINSHFEVPVCILVYVESHSSIYTKPTFLSEEIENYLFADHHLLLELREEQCIQFNLIAHI